MDQPEETLSRIVALVRGLGILEVPMIMTEQYPKGLGPTVSQVTAVLPAEPVVKSAFSCCDDSYFSARLENLGCKTVLLAGIEAHVCVLQTTVDLLERGYMPVVVADATSSRNPRDRDIAFRRMEAEGARLTTVESILFELTRESGTPLFKEISRLVK
jgi:nicotinamidase-related amidase